MRTSSARLAEGVSPANQDLVSESYDLSLVQCTVGCTSETLNMSNSCRALSMTSTPRNYDPSEYLLIAHESYFKFSKWHYDDVYPTSSMVLSMHQIDVLILIYCTTYPN
jgi:hypothetical protein